MNGTAVGYLRTCAMGISLLRGRVWGWGLWLLFFRVSDLAFFLITLLHFSVLITVLLRLVASISVLSRF